MTGDAYDSAKTKAYLKEVSQKLEEAARAMWPAIDNQGFPRGKARLYGRAAACLETAAELLHQVANMIEAAGELEEKAEAEPEPKRPRIHMDSRPDTETPMRRTDSEDSPA